MLVSLICIGKECYFYPNEKCRKSGCGWNKPIHSQGKWNECECSALGSAAHPVEVPVPHDPSHEEGDDE